MTRRRRVLMLVENLSVPFDRRVWKECCALTEAGYQVTAISPKGKAFDTTSRDVIDGVTIYRYRGFESSGSALSYIVEYAVALVLMTILAWMAFFRRGFDIVHIANPPDLLILVALPFKIFGTRIIFDQHDLSPEIYSLHNPRGGRPNVIHRLLLGFEYLTYRLSDVVICVTKSLCEVAESRGGVRSENLFLVRNGPELKAFRQATADDSLRLGKRFLLSYVGMMGPQDGVDILLRSVKLLVSKFGRDDFRVHVVGDGTELDNLKLYATELGVADYVTFAGRQNYERVISAIAAADVCLCPDPKTPMTDRANLVKVTEYMCVGRPVVAFDLNEVRYSAGDAALYASANDELDFAGKIDSLLDDAGERQRRGQLGAQRVRDFLAWDHSKQALYAAYDRALRRTAQPLTPPIHR
jgi:glycosyltransferase involved in cell wall biosynthesis